MEQKIADLYMQLDQIDKAKQTIKPEKEDRMSNLLRPSNDKMGASIASNSEFTNSFAVKERQIEETIALKLQKIRKLQE